MSLIPGNDECTYEKEQIRALTAKLSETKQKLTAAQAAAGTTCAHETVLMETLDETRAKLSVLEAHNEALATENDQLMAVNADLKKKVDRPVTEAVLKDWYEGLCIYGYLQADPKHANTYHVVGPAERGNFPRTHQHSYVCADCGEQTHG